MGELLVETHFYTSDPASAAEVAARLHELGIAYTFDPNGSETLPLGADKRDQRMYLVSWNGPMLHELFP